MLLISSYFLSRSQTNYHSQVLQLPCMYFSGLHPTQLRPMGHTRVGTADVISSILHGYAACMVYGQSSQIKHVSKSMISRSLKVISGQCHILSMAYCKDHSIARLQEANARLHGQCYVDVDRHVCILWQHGQVCGAT